MGRRQLQNYLFLLQRSGKLLVVFKCRLPSFKAATYAPVWPALTRTATNAMLVNVKPDVCLLNSTFIHIHQPSLVFAIGTKMLAAQT